MADELNRKLMFLDTSLAEVQDEHKKEMGKGLKKAIDNLRRVIEKEEYGVES